LTLLSDMRHCAMLAAGNCRQQPLMRFLT